MSSHHIPAPILEIAGDSVSTQRLHNKLRRELGADFLKMLDAPGTEDIILNPDGALWVMGSEGAKIFSEMRPNQALSAIGTIANLAGVTVTEKNPILETTLQIDDSRVEALIPPIVTAPAFAIRKQNKAAKHLEDLERAGILTYKDDPANYRKDVDTFLDEMRGLSHADVIRRACEQHKNILICGGTASGKTTLAKGVMSYVERVSPNDRIVIIEDTSELVCQVPNHIKLLTSLDVDMRRLLKCSMRLRPDRIVVGEVRDANALTVLEAWNTGHGGGIATTHAESAIQGLDRFQSLVRQATEAPMKAEIARTIDLVVWITRDDKHPAGRKVKEVCAVLGYEGDNWKVEYL